ncbi:MAG: hypothetical protein IKT00_13145 [Prevotella sp.]|nr:hypothetical protein [Prevotella sp.]
MLTSSIECWCPRQLHTLHLPALHCAPLHGATLLRRDALFHSTTLQSRRSAWLVAQPVAHPSITPHFCHLACGTPEPSLAPLANTRRERCKHPLWQCHKGFHRTLCLFFIDFFDG